MSSNLADENNGRNKGLAKDAHTLIWIVLAVASAVIFYLIIDFKKQRESSSFVFCEGNLMELGAALKNYAADNNQCYPEKMESLVPHYISMIKVCPAPQNRLKKEGYRYDVSSDWKTYTITCKGQKHHLPGAQPDYPVFCSDYGRMLSKRYLPVNNEEKVRLLIKHNPEKAKQYIRDNPTIVNAVSQGDTLINDVIDMRDVNVDMVRFLVENKADLAIKNRNGQTPLQRAKELERLYSRPNQYNQNWASDYKKYQDLVKILEKAGAKE